jgi:hypothetical protein
VNRLIAFTGMSLHAGNWRSVLLTALLIAQKVWDDRWYVFHEFLWMMKSSISCVFI